MPGIGPGGRVLALQNVFGHCCHSSRTVAVCTVAMMPFAEQGGPVAVGQ